MALLASWLTSERLPACAGLGLLLVPCEALKACARQVGTDDCESCLPTLLRFVIKGEADLFDKVGEVGMGVAKLPQKAALSDEDAAKGGAFLKEVGAIFLSIVDRRRDRDILCEEPGVLSTRSARGIGKDVTDGVCCCEKRQIWLRRQERRNT